MSKSQRERCWTTDNLASVVVPRSMAWALELLGHLIPRHNASKVCAHCIDPIVRKRLVFCDHNVCRITFQTLRQCTPRWWVILDPSRHRYISPKGIFGRLTTTATTSALGHEEEGIWKGQPANRQTGGT